MKLFLDLVDYTLTQGATKVDLRELIVAAGHECVVKNFVDLTFEDLSSIDYFIAQRQINFPDYLNLTRKLRTGDNMGKYTRQHEINMLDKWYAHEKLEELGLNYLNTKVINSRDDLVNFEDNMVMLKPRASMQSKSSIDFAYLIMSKTELLDKADQLGIEKIANGEYIIQEAVTNDRPIVFVVGYVNPQGQILIDGALKERFLVNDGYFEDRIRNPDRHLMFVEEVPLNEFDEFYVETVRQIEIVMTHFQAKSTPFCIQAIVDDDNQVQLLDFNFGFGKGYALRARAGTPEYIIDRIKYTYGGADTIPPNTTFFRNVIIDTPNGFTDEIKAYMDQHGILTGIGAVEKDFSVNTDVGPYTFYYKNKSGCNIVAASREEAMTTAENFQAFLSTLN